MPRRPQNPSVSPKFSPQQAIPLLKRQLERLETDVINRAHNHPDVVAWEQRTTTLLDDIFGSPNGARHSNTQKFVSTTSGLPIRMVPDFSGDRALPDDSQQRHELKFKAKAALLRSYIEQLEDDSAISAQMDREPASETIDVQPPISKAVHTQLPASQQRRRGTNEISVFISHSSHDKSIAAALTQLLEAALSIGPESIRCTSVDGHRLSVGAKTDDCLREELLSAKCFIALLTARSLNSTWVLFELGARWGADRHLAPVFAARMTPDQLRGPLPGMNGLSCENESQIHQLVHDIAELLGVDARKPQFYSSYVTALKDASAKGDQADPEVPTALSRVGCRVEAVYISQLRKFDGYVQSRKPLQIDQQLIAWEPHYATIDNYSHVIIDAGFLNHGDLPTILWDFGMSVTINGRLFVGRFLEKETDWYISREYIPGHPLFQTKYQRPAVDSEITADNPLTRSAPRHCWIHFAIEGLRPSKYPQLLLDLEFTDASGKCKYPVKADFIMIEICCHQNQ